MSAGFLTRILVEKRFRDRIPFFGVRIVGAHIKEKLYFAHSELHGLLWLESCRFDQTLDFSGMKMDGWLSLDDSVICNEAKSGTAADLSGASFSSFASMCGIVVNGGMDFGGAEFKRRLDFKDATVRGPLEMGALRVGEHLILASDGVRPTKARKACPTNDAVVENFRSINLTAARIEGMVDLTGATVSGSLSMNSLYVGSGILMKGRDNYKATFADVDLTGSRIDGALNLSNAKATGQVNIIFARIGIYIELSGCEFASLDLSGTRIDGELRLSTKDARPAGHLELRNTSAGVWQAADETTGGKRAGPAPPADLLELDGFVYDRLGGFGQEKRKEMITWPDRWYIAWLNCDGNYTPQPYEHLAELFRKAGYPAKANNILRASRNRAREQARKDGPWWHYVGLSVLRIVMGYGIGMGYFLSLIPVLVFSVIGFVVLECTPEGPTDWVGRAAYSLGQLVPLANVDFKGTLSGWVQLYFVFHRLIGLLLASCLAAGIAGLTQKS